MGRYLSPLVDNGVAILQSRLAADESNITGLQNIIPQLQTKDQQLQAAIDALNASAGGAYKMVAPVINNALWTSGVTAGKTYYLPTNTIIAPTAGWVVNEVTSIFGNCAAANVYLRINSVLTPFNNGAASGNGPAIWDVRAVTAGQTIISAASIYVFNTCGISTMSMSLSNFSFFIPSSQ